MSNGHFGPGPHGPGPHGPGPFGPSPTPGPDWRDWELRRARQEAYELTSRLAAAQNQLTMAWAQLNQLRDAAARAKLTLGAPGDPGANAAQALTILGAVA